jgi:AcrR family transcriptional regulator
MVRPRKAEATDIRRGAVEAALTLLAERGLEITMGEVAAAAGCRAPALYHHFRNKDALLRAVHDEGFRRLDTEKLGVAARTEGDPLARLAEGGNAYVAFALEASACQRKRRAGRSTPSSRPRAWARARASACRRSTAVPAKVKS